MAFNWWEYGDPGEVARLEPEVERSRLPTSPPVPLPVGEGGRPAPRIPRWAPGPWVTPPPAPPPQGEG